MALAMQKAWALWPKHLPSPKGSRLARNLKLSHKPHNGTPIHTVHFVQGGNPFFDFSPSYCFINDYLVLSLTRTGCQVMVDVAKGDYPPLVKEPDYQALNLPAKGVSLHYLDAEKLVMGIVHRAQQWMTLLAAHAKMPAVPNDLLSWSKPMGSVEELTQDGVKGILVWPMQDLPEQNWQAISGFYRQMKDYKPALAMAQAAPAAPPAIQAVPVAEPAPQKAQAVPPPPAPDQEPEPKPQKSKNVTLELMNGQSVTGELLEEGDEGYLIAIPGAGSLSFSKKEILSVER